MIMAAACHPDAQTRVQEELDDVVGQDRGTSGVAKRCRGSDATSSARVCGLGHASAAPCVHAGGIALETNHTTG